MSDELLIVEEITGLGEVFEGGKDVRKESVVQLLLALSVLTEEAIIVI